MTDQGPRATEPPVSDPEWRARLQAAAERSMRQRTQRAEQRRTLSDRRRAGLQTRLATRLARLDVAALDPP